MNTLYKNKQTSVIFGLSPLDIQNGRDAGLTKLTAKEVEAHLNPKPTPEQVLANQIAEAKQYLSDTDHKFYIGYVQKPDEDCASIQALRDEKREFIRANE